MLQRPSQRQLCWRIPTSPTMTPTLFTSCAAALILLCCCCVGHFSANAQWADDSAAFSGTAAPASMPPLMSITSTSFDIVHTPPGANGSHAAAQRRGKFFFDALFGLGSAVVNSGTGTLTAADDEDEDDEDDETDTTKRCDCQCGAANQEIRIVGGRPTGINQYPWVARLVYDGQFHCGASLINSDHVLTAAHCVRRLRRSKIRIILGDYDQFVTTETPAIMRAVSAIIRHRNFDANTYNHDIALMRLRKPVEFSKTIAPVCVPTDPSLDPAGKTGIAVGWGRTSEGGTLPAVVQHVKVPILSLSQCRNMKYRSSRITPNMLCAGKGKLDSCQGDSGGPLLVQNGDKFEIVGIVSWGVGCGRSGYPGVYTRVAKYLPWLRANLDGCLCK